VPGAVLSTPKYFREERLGHAEASRLLDFVGIPTRGRAVARNLPYGDQRRLEIARALATQPKVLLLDEPAAWLDAEGEATVIAMLKALKARGATVVLTSHRPALLRAADRVMVLRGGMLGPGDRPQALPGGRKGARAAA
jgi:branched-chain amino acid transport system ATP-binding protein